MGIFGGNYDKPGPGVDANAPKKKGFFLYLELVGRKFMKFMQAGFAYAVASIPAIILIYFLSAFVFSQPIIEMENIFKTNNVFADLTAEQISQQMGVVTLSICTIAVILFLMIFGSGPASASLAYIFRSFTREEHVWILSDGFDKLKENFKQSIVVFIVDLLVFILVPFAILFYSKMGQQNTSIAMICNFLIYVLLIFTVTYAIMHTYIYQLMVTFNSKLKDIYKNALLLTLAHLPINVLLILISVASVVLPIWFFGVPAILIVVVLALTFGNIIFSYPLHFYASRIIKKKLIDPNVKEEEKKPVIEYEEEETDENEDYSKWC